MDEFSSEQFDASSIVKAEQPSAQPIQGGDFTPSDILVKEIKSAIIINASDASDTLDLAIPQLAEISSRPEEKDDRLRGISAILGLDTSTFTVAQKVLVIQAKKQLLARMRVNMSQDQLRDFITSKPQLLLQILGPIGERSSEQSEELNIQYKKAERQLVLLLRKLAISNQIQVANYLRANTEIIKGTALELLLLESDAELKSRTEIEFKKEIDQVKRAEFDIDTATPDELLTELTRLTTNPQELKEAKNRDLIFAIGDKLDTFTPGMSTLSYVLLRLREFQFGLEPEGITFEFDLKKKLVKITQNIKARMESNADNTNANLVDKLHRNVESVFDEIYSSPEHIVQKILALIKNYDNHELIAESEQFLQHLDEILPGSNDVMYVINSLTFFTARQNFIIKRGKGSDFLRYKIKLAKDTFSNLPVNHPHRKYLEQLIVNAETLYEQYQKELELPALNEEAILQEEEEEPVLDDNKADLVEAPWEAKKRDKHILEGDMKGYISLNELKLYFADCPSVAFEDDIKAAQESDETYDGSKQRLMIAVLD